MERILARLDAGVAITSGYLTGDRPRAPGWRTLDRLELDGWAADRFERARSAGRAACPPPRASTLPGAMATFTTRFLGCKVSFADEQAIRERLLADGHREAERRGETSRDQHLLRHERGGLEVPPGRGAGGAHHGRVYVTGCAANLSTARSTGCPTTSGRRPPQRGDAADVVAGDVGAIGCVQAEHRLDRVRAFVKIQDGCSFSCSFCVIPLVRGATRSRSADAVLAEIRRRVGAGSS